MVVKNFFQTHHFPTQLTHTLLLPVPKRAGAQSVHDFRPNILCSVLYKIISKLLAYRLKGVIAKWIQGNQSAFVAGRQSCDNVIHGHECLRSVMSRKKLPEWPATKLDLSKAYDCMRWDYMYKVQWALGLSQGNQSAFVSGHQSCDNVILGHDCLRSVMSRNKLPAWAAIKLYLSKAYDRMRWDCIYKDQWALGFSVVWCDLIHGCIFSVSFSILLNGCFFDHFYATNVLRQSHPTSPHLFILGTEELSQVFWGSVWAFFVSLFFGGDSSKGWTNQINEEINFN